MSVASSSVALVISSMPVVDSSDVEKYILLRFVRVNDCVPAVSVVPLILSVKSDTDTETLAPSVVTKGYG